MKNLILICFLAISGSLFSQVIDITVTGNWMKNIAASDITEAGNDYPSAYTSNNNQTVMTINPKNSNKPIYVYVGKIDISWNAALNLKVRRTVNGTNNNINISGGSNFQTITSNYYANFFTCTGYHTLIPLQYEITGISVVLPVQSYSTTVYYTVMH